MKTNNDSNRECEYRSSSEWTELELELVVTAYHCRTHLEQCSVKRADKLDQREVDLELVQKKEVKVQSCVQ